MGATGTANVNFGAAPGSQVATVAVTGQTGILTGSAVEAWIQGTISTTDHNVVEHQTVPMVCRIASITAGTGFTIRCSSDWRLTGQFTINWVWN
jgi:hypothetical protein